MTAEARTGGARRVRLVVGIGASAGGLEALQSLFGRVPDDAGLAFVVVLHVDPRGRAALLHAMRRAAGIPVDEARASLAVEPDHVYVAPPDVLLEVQDGRFVTRSVSAGGHVHAPIDHFFHSLTEDRRERAVGIVLSGAGTDGTLGLKAISDGGGMTIAQSPATARFESMPRNAATSGVADHVLAPEAMAEELLAYADNLLRIGGPDRRAELQDSVRSALPRIAEVLQQETGQDFRHYKATTLVRRVLRRMQVLRMDLVDDYLARLQGSRAEVEALFRELLIGVTAFFRDPDAFDALADAVVPRLFEKKGDPNLRVWVPGCATGEEVYTLAMLLREEMERHDHPPRVQIFATDIDERALQVARLGVYPAGIADDVSQERLERFFVKRGERYHVVKELRELCLFSPHNLISDPPFSRQDLISCRNLLIYLGEHLQNKLIPLFHYALRPGGFLFLGPSESITSHTELFRPIDGKHRISQRKPSAARSNAGLARASFATHEPHAAAPDPENELDVPQVLQRILLDEFTPKGVVVNEEGQIVCASGELSKYLAVGGGSFRNNVIKLARRGLRVGLRATLNEAAKTRRRVVHDSLSVPTEDGVQPLVLTVQPMPRLGEDSELFLCVFEEGGPAVRRDGGSGERAAEDAEALIQQLEAELESTRDDLEKSIQDLEVANEELKSSNEELLSMNEELQSANEELETSKEEVQDAHGALVRAHTDLENLLHSTEIAVVFLDDRLRIRGFTSAVTAIYNLIESDVGRPIWHQTHRAEEMPPLPVREEIDAAGGVVEHTIRTTEGQSFVRRVRRYRTAEGETDGIVVTFNDVTRLRSSEQRFRLMANAAPVLIWMSGADEKRHWFNEGWLAHTGRTMEEELGDGWTEGVHPDDLERCERAHADAFAARRPLAVEYRLRRHDGEYRWILDHGVPLRSGSEFTGYIGTCIDITERRHGEESRATLAAIVESSADAIVSKTLDGIITSWNHGAEKVFGYTAEEAIGRSITLVIPPDRVDEEDMILASLKRGERIEHYETERVTKDGRRIDVSLSISVVRDAAGNVVGAAKVARDVTERKRMERELQHQRERLQLVADSMPAAVAYVGADQRYRFVNLDFQELWRRPSERILGRTVREVAGDENYERARPFIERALAGERQTYEAEMDLPSGRSIRSTTYVPHVLPDGSVAGMHVLSIDVTERRRRENVLAEQARLLNASHDAILVWTSSGGVEFWNDGAADLYGYTREEATGRAPLELLRATLPVPWEEIERAMRRDSEWEGRVTHRRKDGREVVALTRYQVVQRQGGSAILETDRDVTEQVAVESALREATGAAQAANRSKSEFLANTSHEIRSPMTAILGYADLLSRHLSDPDDLQCVRTIRRNGEFLLEIVDDILDLSRIEAGKLEVVRERFPVDGLLHEVVSMMEVRAADKQLPLAVEYDGPVPETIESDATRLRQILVNLIGNAIKFTDAGHIRLVVRTDAAAGVMAFDVKDTGIGMSEEQRERLFRPFTQGDASVTREFGGSGLGLAISQRLAGMLGGAIVVRSTLGAGSTFTLTVGTGDLTGVPLIEPREAVMRSDAAPAAARRLSCRVLVVDDRRDIRLLVQQILEEVGAEVVMAVDGSRAIEELEAARRAARPIDVVLLDMQMPVMDGYEAARRMRDAGYDGAVVALTAHAMKGDHERCRAAGCDDYLAKPIDARTLVEAVARNASRAAPAAPSAAGGEDDAPQEARRVLVVDDNVDTLTLMELVLRSRGHDPRTAADARSALEVAADFRPHVVLLDLTLPDMDGLDLARHLRELDATREAVLVALTGREVGEGDEEAIRAAGLDHYVLKPADLDQLERRFTRRR